MPRRRKPRSKNPTGAIAALLAIGVLYLFYADPDSFAFVAFSVVVVLLGILVVLLYFKYRARERLRLAGIDLIDTMSGEEFERRLKLLFEGKGYSVDLTGKTGDWGADLVLRGRGERIAVQAKRYEGNVGVKAVQEIVAALPKHNCQRGMVVTNSAFTRAAVELARANGVELWDREWLIAELVDAARRR